MKKILIMAVIAATSLSASAETPLWMRDARISPDGKTIVFTYKGDLWKVAATGGSASRLTSTSDNYEGNPIWSPDSRYIAFACDRHGNNDIFIMSVDGGAPRRLTFNSASEIPEAFTPDGNNVVFSAAIQAPAQSAQFPTSRITQLYQVPVKGGAATQILGTPAKMIDFLPDKSGKMVYQDAKGFENTWRKHHTSSVTCDIWLYDPATGKHTNITDRPGEDRDPVVVGDELFFISEPKGGTLNVYKAPLSDAKAAKPVTSFKSHPVRFLSASDGGILCYTYDGEIYTQAPGGKPSKVRIDVINDIVDEPYKMSISLPSGMAVSPDGKSVAFISRGNVFVTSVEYATTKQITTTPEAEKWVSWGHDSKSLIYTSERDGKYNIYKATMARDDDPNFANATIIKEEPLFKNDGHERTVPKMSPDGKQLAFILDRNKLAVMDMETKKVRELTDGTTYKARNGEFNYSWSPKSDYITLEVTNRDPYTDIALLNVATGELTNITQSGYFDESPRFTADGNAIIFGSEHFGMRNHASWGSMMDVLMVFLNQEAYDEYMMSKEDAELATEAKKNKKDDDDSDDSKDGNDKKDKKSKKVSNSDSTNVDLKGISDRIVRLTPFSADLRDAIVTADGKTLFFITAGDGSGNNLWEFDMRDRSISSSKSIPSSLRAFDASSDGKKLFLFGSTMQSFAPSTKKLTPITYKGAQTIDPIAEREYMFDFVTREEAERFYDKGMHGVDWPGLTTHYRKFLPHITNNHDFSEMLSEMLGELNVSHTGSGASSYSSINNDRTAALGLIYDLTYDGKGLKVAEVVNMSPFDNASSKLKPGMVIEKINGEEISHDSDFSTLLTDKAGHNTLVSIFDPATDSRWEEVIKPISTAAMNDLLYQRWIDARAADVDKWSNGRLGYVHIKSMNDASFREVYSDLLGKYNDREGVVVDIRFNGGGRLHEDVEVLLTGDKYLTQEIRGVKSCDMPSRRWNKPSVMVMNEACYSNAHGTPWVYRNRNIGKLVGMPVAGTMTSVNWVDLQDPLMYFGIPVIGYRTAEGNFLENTQLEPDVMVNNDPEIIVTGEDQQLHKAVEVLLNQIDKK